MNLTPLAVQEAAKLLASRRRAGEQGPRLPDSCRPADLNDALAIQLAVQSHMADDVGAWKCGTPAPDRIVVAPIYQQTISSAPVCQVWHQHGQVRVEPELAFVLNQDLPTRDHAYEADEVLTALSHAHLALELIDSRYDEQAELTFADRLADGLVNQGLWLGPRLTVAQASQAHRFPIDWAAGAGPVHHLDGRHPNDAPLAPLHWLVEHMRTTGQGLRAGQAVITGSFAGTFACPLDLLLHFSFGPLGRFEVTFQARSPA